MENPKTQSKDRAFGFLKFNDRPAKPRSSGVTEIRGPYYTPMGKRYLQDILETMGAYVDILKFAGGSFSLMPRKAVKELIDLCHEYNVLVDTGGLMDHVLTQGPEMVDRYIRVQGAGRHHRLLWLYYDSIDWARLRKSAEGQAEA
jgi:phosphosulfolactate synthase (CoM biosynthesis protein A)